MGIIVINELMKLANKYRPEPKNKWRKCKKCGIKFVGSSCPNCGWTC